MRNPKPICSCPQPGRIHGLRRNRTHEQNGRGNGLYLGGTQQLKKNLLQGKTPASSTALLFSHLAIWHTRLGVSLRSSPYRNNKEKQPSIFRRRAPNGGPSYLRLAPRASKSDRNQR